MVILINKKRVVMLLSIIVVSIFVFVFQTTKSEKTVQVISLPTTDKTIILDAGHGEPDGGAVSANGVKESEINLKIVMTLKQLLEQSGTNVILTRSDENGIYDQNAQTIKQQKISDTKNRTKIGNESGADLFVSIHLNQIDQSQYYGWQTFYKKSDEQGKRLAEKIQENLNQSIQKANKRIASTISGIYIVDHVQIPITIVECGFLSNSEEEKLLQDESYQNRLAWGIYTGIMDYFME